MQDFDLTTSLTKEELDSVVEVIAGKIVKRRLEMAAVLILEMHKPLSFVASQAAVVAMPLVGPLLGMENMATLSRLLRDRENVEVLITRIEERALARDTRRGRTAESRGPQ